MNTPGKDHVHLLNKMLNTSKLIGLGLLLNLGINNTSLGQQLGTGVGLEKTTMNKDEMETFMSTEGIYNTGSKDDILKFRPTLNNYQLRVVYDIFDRCKNTGSRYRVFFYYIRREIDKDTPKKYKRVEKTVKELTPEQKKRCDETVDESMRLATIYILKE